MHFKRFLAYLRGYVILRVEGKFLEKFVNLSILRGIYFFDVKNVAPEVMEVGVFIDDFWELRHIAKKVSCKIKIKSKHGFPFFKSRIKNRKMLIAGLIFFIVTLYVMSGFVWKVEVKSFEELKNISEEEILQEASKLGLRPGILKKNIDLRDMENTLVQNIDVLSWVAIDIEGTKVIIRVVERVLPAPEYLEKNPAHVVAKKEGRIEEMLVLVGEPKVEVGDIVKKGQILISGSVYYSQNEEDPETNLEEIENQEVRHVRARGIVRASVWYEKKYNVKLKSIEKRETGSQITNFQLKIGENTYFIKGRKDIPYKNYEREVKEYKLENKKLPVKLVKTVYSEVQIVEKKISEKKAIESAVLKAKKEIGKNLNSAGEVVDIEVNTLEKNTESIKIAILFKTLEDIAKVYPF